jgi:hypothetical protein
LDQLKEQSNQHYGSLSNIAIIYARLGDKDQAFAWLEEAYQDRDELLIYLNIEPRLNSLRSNPHFIDLLQRVEL